MKQFHACSNCVKVIKLPSHSTYICTIPNKNEEKMRTTYLLLEIVRRLAAQWFRSRLCITVPFCFPFASMMMKVTAGCLGSFWFTGGDWEDGDVNVGFSGFLCLRLSLFFGSVYFLSLCFLGIFLCLPRFFFSPSPFARSPLLSLYRASGSLGGGNGWPPKCSITDTFNEETSVLAANGRNASAFNGRAVAK